jgi:hypothetical protein
MQWRDQDLTFFRCFDVEGLGPAPARIPYFDGDFWPMEAEELLLEFWKEAEKIKNDAAEAIAEEG